jgi:hypothetical protein
MEPNQPANDAGKQSDPYAFIMKPSGGSKLPKLPLSGLPNTVKLLLLGGGGILLLIIVFFAYKSLFSTPENSDLLASVGRQQANILQVAEIGEEKARGQAARNLAITTKLSLIDDQKSLKAAFGDKNVSVSTSDDPELEQRFTVADQANRFDDELLEYMHTELTSYARNLQAAYNTTLKTDKELREVLAAQYKNARFLAGEGAAESN